MSTVDIPLAGEFPPATADGWRELVDATLRGADFDSKLVTFTHDGQRIDPLYTSADAPAPEASGFPGLQPFTRGATAAGYRKSGWDVRQAHPVGDGINEAALADLAGGVTSLLLGFSGPDEVADLPTALRDVLLDVAPVALDAGPWYRDAAAALVSEWRDRNLPPSVWLGSLRADPVGALARHGALQGPVDRALADLADLVSSVADSPGVRAIAVDATVYGDAGAGDVEEVAASLATGVAYLRALTESGISVDEALATMEFTYSATADQFATICRLRAARRCWARVAEACGATGDAGAQYQHAVTSAAMMSRCDPWVNLLRTTVATFAAGTGGAQAVTIRPFDEALGVPDAFGRRLARNIGHVLTDESRLGDVIDPAGGSHYVEHRTDEISRLAWARFQEIEAAGGIVESLTSGAMQARVEVAWAARLDALATRRDPLTGVSEFPDLGEARIERPPSPDRAAVQNAATTVTPLPLRRLAEPFERLRDIAASADPRPTIFLANLGPVADHTARANFAKNWFEAGGIEALGSDGFDSPDDLARAFADSGASAAVLCGSDALYPEVVPWAAAALRDAGCERIYLAGRPGERADSDAAAGVDEHIHVGADLLASLADALGVEP